MRLIYFGSMEEDEECDYDPTLIDDSSAQGGDKENRSVGGDKNMCKDVIIEVDLMQSQVENDYMKMWSCKVSFDMPWMVLLMNMKNVDTPSQFDVKSIMTYVEVGESRIFKSTLVSQLNGNPT